MTEQKKKENVGGRGNTRYKPELNELAHNYCILGAMDEELAHFFSISVRTLSKWKKKYPDFQESIKTGKELADMKVAGSLYRKAIGYAYQEVLSQTVKVPVCNSGMDGTFSAETSKSFEIIKVTTKEIIPDTRAQIFWLKNRQPKRWKDKQEVVDKSAVEKKAVITIFELPNDGRND